MDSRGRTSNHHPWMPLKKQRAPTIETNGLVTRPAKSKVVPKANMIGAEVGAGIDS